MIFLKKFDRLLKLNKINLKENNTFYSHHLSCINQYINVKYFV